MAVIHQKIAKEVPRMAEWVGSRRLSLWWWRYLRKWNPEPCVARLYLKRLRITCQKPLSIGIDLRRVTEKTVCRANTSTSQATLLGAESKLSFVLYELCDMEQSLQLSYLHFCMYRATGLVWELVKNKEVERMALSAVYLTCLDHMHFFLLHRC